MTNESLAGRNVRRLRKILETLLEPSAIPETHGPHRVLAIQTIQFYLLHRPFFKRSTTKKKVFKMTWTSNKLQGLPLRKLFAQHAALLPAFSADIMDNITIARRVVPSYGRSIFNFAKVARNAAMWNPPATCDCTTRFPRANTRKGHVCTGDLSELFDEGHSSALLSIFQLGPNERPEQTGNLLNTFGSDLTEWIESQIRQAGHFEINLEPAEFQEWKEKITAGWKDFIASRPTSTTSTSPQLATNPALMAELREIQQRIMLGLIDKTSNNTGAMCINLDNDETTGQLEDADIYEFIDKTEAEVIDDIVAGCATFGVVVGKDHWKLSYLYPAIKWHSNGYRFIAGGSSIAMTDLAVVLDTILKHTLQTLRVKDDASLRATGIRRFFVVERPEEVAQYLRRTETGRPPKDRARLRRRIDSRDFKTLYTTLPLLDLIDKVFRTVCAAFEYLKIDRIWVHREYERVPWIAEPPETNTRSGGTHHSNNSHVYALPEIKRMLKFVVENTFIMNGGRIFRQILGLPMGINPAPTAANLYLHWYEADFIDTLVAYGQTAKAKDYNLTFRLIDDLLALDNPHIDKDLQSCDLFGGIYCQWLYQGLTPTNADTVESEGTFAGILLQVTPDLRIKTTIFDKRRAFPFQVLRYVNPTSTSPRDMLAGIFVGQLHRCEEICADYDDFCKEAAIVADIMLRKGCDRKMIEQKFVTFCGARAGPHYRTPLRRLQDFFEAEIKRQSQA